MGLELTMLRSRATCSTHWASQTPPTLGQFLRKNLNSSDPSPEHSFCWLFVDPCVLQVALRGLLNIFKHFACFGIIFKEKGQCLLDQQCPDFGVCGTHGPDHLSGCLPLLRLDMNAHSKCLGTVSGIESSSPSQFTLIVLISFQILFKGKVWAVVVFTKHRIWRVLFGGWQGSAVFVTMGRDQE